MIDGGKVEWHGAEFFMLATKETIRGMKKAAIYTQGVAKELIGGEGSGEPDSRGHQPSMPGEPPARDTGRLASSVGYKVKVKMLTVQGFVGPDEAKLKGRGRKSVDPLYGLWLELGTKYMSARPWLRPAVLKATPKIVRILKKAVSAS